MNRRVSVTQGGVTTYFHYDGATPNVIAETDGEGATIAMHAYYASGRLHSMTRAGEVYYYHTDARGDVVAMTNDAGEIVNEYSYDPYGNPLSVSETVKNPYRYASYRFDEATGLYYCWNRYYDPENYRFITADLYPGELSDPASMNAYAYCGGDPVNFVDPSGLGVPIVVTVVLLAVIVLGTIGTYVKFQSYMVDNNERLMEEFGLERPGFDGGSSAGIAPRICRPICSPNTW